MPFPPLPLLVRYQSQTEPFQKNKTPTPARSFSPPRQITFPSEATDYGSAHFSHTRRGTDGLHIKRPQTCQWPFIRVRKKKVGWRWHSFKKEIDLKWFDFSIAFETASQLERNLRDKYIHLDWCEDTDIGTQSKCGFEFSQHGSKRSTMVGNYIAPRKE